MNAALERLRRTYARMDQAIADSGGPWLLGKQPTLADVAVMPALVRMADLGLATMWQDLPRVQRWFEEIRAHPAFKPTYYFGSLLTERFPHFKERAGAPGRNSPPPRAGVPPDISPPSSARPRPAGADLDPGKFVASSTQLRGAGSPHRFELDFGLTTQRIGSSSMSMIWMPGRSSSVRCPSGSRT